jgi:vacuolar iron transporter family protein
MSEACAGVRREYSARITTTARAPPTIWAANAGTEAGAIPAKVSENIRPTVMAGLAKLVEDVKKYAAPIYAPTAAGADRLRPERASAKITRDQPEGGDHLGQEMRGRPCPQQEEPGPAGLVESMSADDIMPSAAQVQAAAAGRGTHPREPHTGGTAGRLNWLRAAVLGANDGIVSVAGIVIGVAGATSARGPIFTAGLAGLVAGAVSMALGEYVSVSSQRDSERAEMTQEKRELADTPEAELTELTALYEAKGLSAATARTVATELTSHGALAAHLDAELHIDPDDIPSPVQAAAASALSFTSGALLPLLAILLPPAALRVPVTFATVLIALGLAGALSARLGGSNIRRAVLRLFIGGALGLAFTYGIGHLFGTAIG